MEQLRQDGQRQQLIYDGANRLIEVLLHDGRRSRYRYDALGRRLAQTTEGASGAPMRYHGWDGDRLVHTEQVDATQPGQRHITHTVYEPETFTPLVQLSATASAQAKPQVLALMAQSQDEDDNGDDNAQMVAMLDALPQDMRQALEQSLRQAMQDGIPQSVKALMPDQSQNTLQRLTGLREQLEKQEQNQQTEITVRHYHCDHLGTPIALTDEQQNIVWAARLDPWGNIEQEFNPHDIEQSIRLPGQHHDKETGLYYNRHRYYDPSIGAYVNQDPIGLAGGWNKSLYSAKPLSQMDPLGLQGWDAVPIFNGGLPGNQAAITQATNLSINGPAPLSPALPFSLSLETNAMAQAVAGQSHSAGYVFGMRENLSIIKCRYITACNLLGLGATYSVGGGIGISNSAPASGTTSSSGYVMGGGLLGSGAVQATKDAGGAYAIGAAAGKGDGATSSLLSCVQETIC